MVEAKTVFEFNDCKVMTSKDKKTLVFPVVDAEKRQIRLHLTARFDWKSLSGYTFGMKIFVNGKDITGVRLLNKPLAFKTRNGGGTYWSRPDINRWNVVYSPDFSDKVKTDVNFRYGIYEKDANGNYALSKLFDEIAPRFAERNGGYTRVIKLGVRRGDAAEMAVIQFVE